LCVVRNNEAPPRRSTLDEQGIALYEERGITILQDNWEDFIASLFLRSVESGENALKLNFRLVELWCEKEEINILETHDVLSAMLQEANKESLKRWKKS
jgi:hypothetical protein